MTANRDHVIHIDITYIHCQSIEYTKSIDMGLTSAEFQESRVFF